MAEESFPFDGGANSATEDRWRKMARNWGSGVVSSSAATPLACAAGTGQQIIIKGGQALVDGCFYSTSPSEPAADITVVPTANVSTNPVRGTVVLELDPVANQIIAKCIFGTPAVSPVAKALTQSKTGVWQEPLYDFTMPGSASPQNPTAFLDRRSFSDGYSAFTPIFTAAAGTPTVGNGSLVGRIRKQGKQVHAKIRMQGGSTTSWGANAMFFGGLPYAAGGGLRAIGRASVYTLGADWAAYSIIENGTTQVYVRSVFSDTSNKQYAIQSADGSLSSGTGNPRQAGVYSFGDGSVVEIDIHYESA